MNSDFGCKREEEELNIIINSNCNYHKSATATAAAATNVTTSEESELCQQYSSPIESSPSSLSSSSSSSSSASTRKSYNRKRFSYSFKIIFFLYLIFMFLGTTNAITFFYGASGPEGDNDKTLRPFGELSYHEEAMEGPIPDLSEDELRTVYGFCQLLPTMEKMGRVRKSKVTRAICERLIVILTPMFSKSSSNKPLI